MAASPIYLDYNATTPILEDVLAEMLPYLTLHFGNPSSAHSYGRRARQAVDLAREQVASLIGCDPQEIIFTSGATEANNLAIFGSEKRDRRRVVTSVVEHPATAQPVAALGKSGFEVARLGVDPHGRVSGDELASAIDESTALVSLMHSNGETGVLQPVRDAVCAAKSAGALVHTDAAQSVGKIPVDVRELGVDFLSIAAHKLHGPKGVGALYVRRGLALSPVLRGASHEGNTRPGTENVASIVGFGAACRIAQRDLRREGARIQALRDELWRALGNSIPGAVVSGHATERLPNTLNVRLPGVSGLEVLDLASDVAASTGSACHAGTVEPSAVLLAMGVPPPSAIGAIRLSMGRLTTAAEVARAAESLISAWHRLANNCAKPQYAETGTG